MTATMTDADPVTADPVTADPVTADPVTADAVQVQQHPDDADGNHSATLRGHGLRLTMRLRHDSPPISASQAAELAECWAAMLVALTGGDRDA